MDDRSFSIIRQLPRAELETFAIKAALHLRHHKNNTEKGGFFVAILTGFLLGALVAASGFILGAGLS